MRGSPKKKRASLEEVSEADTSGCCTATTGIGNAIINNKIKITYNDNDATNAAGDNEENAFVSNKLCIDYSKRGTAKLQNMQKNILLRMI